METELDLLKERATQMGLTFRSNIGVEALKAKIEQALSDEPENEDEDANTQAPAARAMSRKEREQEVRRKQMKEQMKLVRIRITNLNPLKKDLPGEIFTVSNRYIGTVRKFIPYGETSENGYHVPYCIYNELKQRKFNQVRTRKLQMGATEITQKLVPEFAIEVLPQLTEKELEQLARQQAAAAGL